MLRQPDLPTVDPVEAERRLREDPRSPVLLDVREAHEFTAVRVEGALLVPTSAFIARAGEVPTDRPILVICHTGSRSAAVTGYLLRAGNADVTNVAGGMALWERMGLPVRRGPLSDGEGSLPA